MELTQYEIVLVNLDPTIGSEMQKTRPAVIISPNEMNKYLNTVVIAPMTSNSKTYPTRVEVKHNKTIVLSLSTNFKTIVVCFNETNVLRLIYGTW